MGLKAEAFSPEKILIINYSNLIHTGSKLATKLPPPYLGKQNFFQHCLLANKNYKIN